MRYCCPVTCGVCPEVVEPVVPEGTPGEPQVTPGEPEGTPGEEPAPVCIDSDVCLQSTPGWEGEIASGHYTCAISESYCTSSNA